MLNTGYHIFRLYIWVKVIHVIKITVYKIIAKLLVVYTMYIGTINDSQVVGCVYSVQLYLVVDMIEHANGRLFTIHLYTCQTTFDSTLVTYKSK